MYISKFCILCFKAVDLLPPMSPLSFDPASEEVYAESILLQYPASLPGQLLFSLLNSLLSVFLTMVTVPLHSFFPQLFFIVVKCTSFHYCKVYISVAYSKFTEFCNHHHCPVPEYFCYLKRIPVFIKSHFPFPLLPVLMTTNVLQVSAFVYSVYVV